MKSALNTLMRWVRIVDAWLAQPFSKIKNPKWKAAAIAGALASIIWLVVAFVIPLAPFGSNSLCTNDGYAQYMPFLSEVWSIFKENGSIMYSFHGALGSNFYLTIAYYLLSPFTFLVLLFDKSQIPAAANLIIILKNIMVIVTMAWYLGSKSRRTRSFLNAACAICYGFSFYFLGYAVNFMWMDSIAMVPIILYGMERIDTRKGRVIYLLSLTWTILTNFYMGVIVCIFLALYYVVMEMEFDRNGLRSFIWFALCSLCAAIMAGVVLVPVIEGMLMDNASRMSPPNWEIYNDAKYFFSRLLPDAEVVRITHNRGAINLYMGTAVLFGSLLFVTNDKLQRRERFGLAFLCLLYLAATQVSTLNYIFHGFYMQRQVPNRFGFLIALLATIMLQQGFLHLRKDQFWKVGILGFISAIYFGVVSALTDIQHIWIGFILAALCLLYLLAALARRRKILGWLIIIESTVGLVMLAPGSLDGSFTQMAKYIEAARLAPGYRSEIVCSEIVNAPYLYGLNGVSAFSSVINPDTASLLGKLGYASGENYYRFYGYTPLSSLFLGVKNIIADDQETLPDPFVKSAQYEDLVIWSSPYDTPLGLCLVNPDGVFTHTNKFENLNSLYPEAFTLLEVNATMTGDSDFEFTETDQFTLRNIKAGHVNTFRLAPFEGRYVYLYGNAGGTKKFTLTKNGEKIATNKYEGNIVYLGTVFYSDVLEVTFEAESDRNEQVVQLQLASLSPDKTAEAAQAFQDRGLKNQVVKNSTLIQGTYTATQPETMVFTIPYDQGWSAFVNGSQVNTKNWNNAFVAIDLDPGENVIELKYKPPGLKAGLIFSGIGCLLAFFLLLDSKWHSRFLQLFQSKGTKSQNIELKESESQPSSLPAQAEAIKQRQERAKKQEQRSSKSSPQAEAIKNRNEAARLKKQSTSLEAPQANALKERTKRMAQALQNSFPKKPQAEALIKRAQKKREPQTSSQKTDQTIAQSSNSKLAENKKLTLAKEREDFQDEIIKTFSIEGIDVPKVSNRNVQDNLSEVDLLLSSPKQSLNQPQKKESKKKSLNESKEDHKALKDDEANDIVNRLQAESQKETLEAWQSWALLENTSLKEKLALDQTNSFSPEEMDQDPQKQKVPVAFGPYGLKTTPAPKEKSVQEETKVSIPPSLEKEEKTLVERDWEVTEFSFSDQAEQQLAEHLAADFLQRMRRISPKADSNISSDQSHLKEEEEKKESQETL